MKGLLSKEHYCCKIHTLLRKSIAYPFFYRQPTYMDYPPFLQENLDPPFYDFSKIPTQSINKGGMVHTIYVLWSRSNGGNMGQGIQEWTK